MKINRSKFIRHLERIACAGQIKEVVFHGAFEVNALTADQLLFISAPAMDGASPLPREIGVSDLGLLIKALKLLTGEGNTSVEVDVFVNDSNQLVIDDSPRGVQYLLTAKPTTIATRVEDDIAEKMVAFVPEDAPGAPLGRSTLDGVCNAYALYKAEEIEVIVGKKAGVVRVGTTKTHRAEFELAEISCGKSNEYTLLFGEHLKDVFSIVTDFSTAQVQFAGEKRPVLVTDGDYLYVVSPRSRSAEDSKPPLKEAKGEETAPTDEKPTPKRRRGAKAAASE